MRGHDIFERHGLTLDHGSRYWVLGTGYPVGSGSRRCPRFRTRACTGSPCRLGVCRPADDEVVLKLVNLSNKASPKRMIPSCAACRRAPSRSTGRAMCASCRWREAQTSSHTAAAAEMANGEHSDTGAHSEVARPSDLYLLFRLAPLVGENGADAVERVLRQLVRGNTRTYRAELNRLAAKFITSIEP